ncbi:BNR repeat-containing protein [Membranicola marinus]|uniref:BNR repeat-containing protein n=1 Tax=Membranihabitans marinus TaxID=1227546 RepID=A0A953LAI3_9BACT|nr:BNR-4 repeat-containing protein [Membranihabitans marinus]MBY5958738.1 BNR repeat-containing protein [Membranihabitans marinus]
MRLLHLLLLITHLIIFSCSSLKSGSKENSSSKDHEQTENKLTNRVVQSENHFEVYTHNLENTRMDGYRGIWFELGQKFDYGDKYSGGLGTYTAKHVPLAVYAPKVDQTFFVYGGTPSDTSRHLLCMIGVYDHKSGMVAQPTVVCDKQGVIDPHDNPSVMIDDEGYIWVFVSGRGKKRPGFKYRSREPFSIDNFEKVTEEEMTYPQPWNTKSGLLHLFTKYTGVRQLYWEHSQNGMQWSDDQLLAAIPQEPGEKSGHYQISATWQGKRVGTFFNRHPQGNVDQRTDLYYLQTDDLGNVWTDAAGNKIDIPVIDPQTTALVKDFYTEGKNIYLKDMGFTKQGHPVGLFIKSNGHEPGPENAPYEWFIAQWNGKKWDMSEVTTSDHNYDMGSLYLAPDRWRVVGPTTSAAESPQPWGVGGEVVIWTSTDQGKTWEEESQITHQSRFNHSYVRRPFNFKPPFCFFWSDGDPHQFSSSTIYFGDFEGQVWKLPGHMNQEWMVPEKVVE